MSSAAKAALLIALLFGVGAFAVSQAPRLERNRTPVEVAPARPAAD